MRMDEFASVYGGPPGGPSCYYEHTFADALKRQADASSSDDEPRTVKNLRVKIVIGGRTVCTENDVKPRPPYIASKVTTTSPSSFVTYSHVPM